MVSAIANRFQHLLSSFCVEASDAQTSNGQHGKHLRNGYGKQHPPWKAPGRPRIRFASSLKAWSSVKRSLLFFSIGCFRHGNEDFPYSWKWLEGSCWSKSCHQITYLPSNPLRPALVIPKQPMDLWRHICLQNPRWFFHGKVGWFLMICWAYEMFFPW